MAYQLSYGTVRESDRQAIYVLRIHGEILDPAEIDDLAERMRDYVHSRGEIATDVVVVQGDAKETLRLFGNPYSVSRVRAAMFNAALRFAPINLE